MSPLLTPLESELTEEVTRLREERLATLNLLEDLESERRNFEDMHRATFNVLEDIARERAYLESTQKAAFNILDDFYIEQNRMQEMQRATFNIFEDFVGEQQRSEETQRAAFNILEDFVNDREKLEDMQRAAFNILEDLNYEKSKLQREIGERKKAEISLENANRELEAFSYSVSHDLRAPLRGIDGFSQALLEDYGTRFDENGQTYLRYLREASQQMAQLIDDLLNLSRMTRSEMMEELVNVSSIVQTIASNLQQANPERNIHFEIAPDAFCMGDARLLKVALENLINNAWKFTSKTENARIEFGTSTSEGREVYFIRDNGAGFDMAYKNKLFGAFQRLHRNTEYPGTGIGLATVRRIIHRHGGEIWAEGAVNQGATFFFLLSRG